MNTTIKQEAITRMIKLGLAPECIQKFKEEEVVLCSIDGQLTEMTEEMNEIVGEFEKRHKGKVYHAVISNHLPTGKRIMLSLFYVCVQEDEWEYDHEDLRYNEQTVYVHNFINQSYSEIGCIRFVKVKGCLERIG